MHITNENECKKNVLIEKEKSFLPDTVISLFCASASRRAHLNILLLLPSLPSFSCCPRPQTMHLKGDMSHGSKLLSGLGHFHSKMCQSVYNHVCHVPTCFILIHHSGCAVYNLKRASLSVVLYNMVAAPVRLFGFFSIVLAISPQAMHTLPACWR